MQPYLSSLRLALLAVFAAWTVFSPTRARATESASPFQSGSYHEGRLKFVGKIPVMTVRGTPEEMGEQQAKLTASAIRPLIQMPRQVLKRHGVDVAWPLLVSVSRQMMLNAPDEYQREFEAMIKTTGFGRAELSVANAMLELRRIGGCSTLYVSAERSKTGRPMLGRNFDFDPMGVLDRYSLVTVYQPTGKKSFVSVGFPAVGGVVSGINEDGLCVATLDVYASADGSPIFNPQGVPLAYCYRRLLEECSTIAQAEEMLRSMPRTTWSNLAICDQQRAAVLEITPKNVAVRQPKNGVLPCTNHFRSAGMARNTRCWRYARFLDQTAKGKLGREDLIKRMHAVHQRDWTLQSIIFEPADQKIYVALGKGPVTSGPYQELALQDLWKKTDTGKPAQPSDKPASEAEKSAQEAAP